MALIDWLDSLGSRLYRAFIEGDRWKLYLQGLGTTLEMTVVALIFGVLLGLVVAVVRTAHDQQRQGRSNPLAFSTFCATSIPPLSGALP